MFKKCQAGNTLETPPWPGIVALTAATTCRQVYCQAVIARSMANTQHLDSSTASDSSGDSRLQGSSLVGGGNAPRLTFLGGGCEGMVFTDQQRLYKVCLWGAALQRCPGQLQLLAQLAPQASSSGDSSTALHSQRAAAVSEGRAFGAATFWMHGVQSHGPQWVLTYGPFMPGGRRR